MHKDSKLTPWEKAQVERKIKLKKMAKKKEDLFLKKFPKVYKIRKIRLTKNATILTTIFLICGFISLCSILPFSRVLTIKVRGVDKNEIQEVIKASKIKKYQSIPFLMFEDRKTTNNIKSMDIVKNVGVSYGLGTVTLNIDKYPVIGYVAKNGGYYQLLSSGVLSNNELSSLSSSLPVYYSFKGKKLIMLAKQIYSMDNKVSRAISEIHYTPTESDPEKMLVYMSDGNKVIAKISTFADKMAYYPSIVSKMEQAGIVDLEVGAYSYPYNNTITSN